MNDDSTSRCGSGESPEAQGRPTRRESSVETEDSRVGSVFDERYRIEKRVGAGGMGVVYQAMQMRLERPVVIKVLTEEKLQDETSLKRFEREAKSLSRLDHTNIVTVYDFGRQEGQPYLAMEYVDGVELFDLLDERGALGLGLFSRIASQILDGVAHAHKQGLVHRDLKPSNIMLTTRDEDPYFVKLLDFGLAKLASGAADVTANNRIVGSMPYLSPEQLTGESVDQRADVYALGIVFYKMLSGRKPFRGSSASIVYDQVHSRPPPLSLHLPDESRIPDRLVKLVEACLAKEPDARPNSAGELGEQLEQATEGALGGLGAGGFDQPAPPPANDSHSSRPISEHGAQTAEARPERPESAEYIEEHQTEDHGPEASPAGESDQKLQEALGAAKRQRREGAGGGTDDSTSWRAIIGGLSVAVVLLGAAAFYLTPDGGGAAARGDSQERAQKSFDEQLSEIDQLIADRQFSPADDAIRDLREAADSQARRSALQKRQRRLEASRLYESAEHQRRSGEISSAISSYTELLEVDADFRDAPEKLETLESYGLLEVETGGGEATVQVDGRALGKTPLEAPIAPGEHELVVVNDRGESWTKPIAVEENQKLQFAPTLTVSPESSAGGEVESGEERAEGEPSRTTEGSGDEETASEEETDGQEETPEGGAAKEGGDRPTEAAPDERTKSKPNEQSGDGEAVELLDPGEDPEPPSSGGEASGESESDDSESQLLEIE